MTDAKDDATSGTSGESADAKRLKEFKRQRAVLLGQQTRTKNTMIAMLNTMSVFDIETKLELAEHQFRTFSLVQSEIERLDEEEINSPRRDQYEETYCDLKSQWRQRIDQLRPRSSIDMSALQSTVPPANHASRVHLPKLQLPKFSGLYTEWLDFFAMFSALVHNNAELSDIERFQHLRSCLSGTASNLIQSLEASGANYSKALDLLKARYQNKRFIFQAHIEKICAVQAIKKPTILSIQEIIDVVNGNLRALQSIATNDQIGTGFLFHHLVSKLDPETRAKWEEEVSTTQGVTAHSTPSNSTPSRHAEDTVLRLPTWEDLVTFLERRCQTIKFIEAQQVFESTPHNERSASGRNRNSAKSKPKSIQSSSASFVATNTAVPVQCQFCKSESGHNAFKCPHFLEMPHPDRYQLVKQLRLCLNCLKANHSVRNCGSTSKCQRCKAKHHTLLHREQDYAQDNATGHSSLPIQDARPNSSESSHAQSTTLQVCQDQSEVLLGTALVRIANDNGTTIIARALLDSASQLNFITENIAQKLSPKLSKTNLTINGVGLSSTKARHSCSIHLISLKSHYTTTIEAVIMPTITSYQPQTTINVENWQLPSNIQLADDKFNQPGKIDVLIGASIFYDLLMTGQFKLANSLPRLQETALGWIVSGPVLAPNQRRASTGSTAERAAPHYVHLSTSQDSRLEELLKRFWSIEEIPITDTCFTQEEQDCERYFQETTQRCPTSNKFVVRLPFRHDPSTLGVSRNIADKRLQYLERKLHRDQSLREDYHKFLQEYEDLGHMRLIPVNNIDTRRNYIPHHAVVKADSSSTKLSVVFDASCRTSNGIALNNILKVGPTIQDDLFITLIRFRSHKFVVMADITKMYRQILVDGRDAPYQCIRWRTDPTQACDTFQLQTVTYGTSCAPYLAVKCLQQLAVDGRKAFPIGSSIVARDFYVGNMMTGADSIEQVRAIKTEVTSLLATAGFPLHKWASNQSDVIADVPSHLQETSIQFGDMNAIKALGVIWNPTDDIFSFYRKVQPFTSSCTKRTMLSYIATLFDPLGLLNPVIVRAKIFIQSLWLMKLDWDQVVPVEVKTQWESFQIQLDDVQHIYIDRYVPLVQIYNIHAFADASPKAYGCCVYIVSRLEQSTTSNLLCAKSRVAPTKQLTLPRLELCAALLLWELLTIVTKALSSAPHDVFCWSDSSITLSWLAAEPSRWSTFVANRVAKIQDRTSKFQWKHISSEQNPADLLTRGLSAAELIDNSFWFHGPSFLKLNQDKWPTSQPQSCPENSLEERRKKVTLSIVVKPDIFITCKYINNYLKFLRVVCFVRRFIYTACKQPRHTARNISPVELSEALECVCRKIQEMHFSREIRSITAGRMVERSSQLHSLSPIIENGLIRVGGRLQRALLPYDATHPIVLPNSHPFIRTIISHIHYSNLHAGCQMVLSLLREKFWILRPRRIIRQVVHECIRCFRMKPIVEQKIMGGLPAERVIPESAFSTAGIDYCGPIFTKSGVRGRAPTKTYVALFVCFITKAVHLEIAIDLSTESFIRSLKRFIARRGKCRIIFSDNATNFTGAARKLKELHQLVHSEGHITETHNFCRDQGIEWRFIPPRSPHFGGLWESSIKLAKHHLQRTVGNSLLTHDELATLCCQVEAILNSRPITAISSDPNDMQALTPGHFLIGRPLTSLPECQVEEPRTTYLRRYQYLQWLHQHFWTRWKRDYLTHLQERRKWREPKRDVQQNDLVILVQENTPPLQWPLGRVISTTKGSDNRVRVATIKTSGGTYKRAITRLCVLPIDPKLGLKPPDFNAGRMEKQSAIPR